jgi:hypothetical protein
MPYKPRIDDYVIWHTTPHPLQGWVYFVSEYYITIEIGVKCKDAENIKHCSLHKKTHCLVLCFPPNWEELEYVKNRRQE